MWRVRDQEAASVDHLIADFESSRQGVGLNTGVPKSAKSLRHQITSLPRSVSAEISLSAVDRATVVCCLADHIIAAPYKIITRPDVDRRFES